MDSELEPRAKPLTYKVKAISRESPAQKAAHLLDTDLRNHWSTATNTKEWILLELDEPALLSHIRIYNKSVLEWEISAGLQYKPETFVKVRPRSEAPRRDMTYPMNYTPCRYVRISCMRGNPIAIFFIQLIGIPVSGLEPEFQPVANYLLPYIISQKGDMHLQLLQDVTSRLARFIPHLEVDLNGLSEAAEPTVRFLAMLAGPCYPLLLVVSERETARLAVNGSEYDTSKSNPLSTALTVSSNFEPRRSRNTPALLSPTPCHMAFRPDALFMLLRKAYKDPKLGDVCRTVSRILFRLMEPMTTEAHTKASDIISSGDDGAPKFDACHPTFLNDYSDLFGKEFQIHNDYLDPSCLNLLDNAAVEEGLMHVLYASASESSHCRMLAENTSDIWLSLPLIQALLPALRPTVNSSFQLDDKFSLWKQPFVQNAMSQIVVTSSSTTYRPLLRACAGYLSSFSPSHAKAACVLIDLCSGVLAPWIGQVIAKVDLAIELLEDLLGVIQGAQYSLPRARAALKYIVLALSGSMDDIIAKYKDANHRILFLVEMLEPFLDPAVNPTKGIVFASDSSGFTENQERNCAIAVNVIRTAIKKAAVLPSLETEWRRGSVSPSVLLSVLDAQLQLPHDIDSRKSSSVEVDKAAPSSRNGAYSFKSNEQEHADIKVDDVDTNGRTDPPEDAGLLFAPKELIRMSLTLVRATADIKLSDAGHLNHLEPNNVDQKKLSNQFQNNLGSDMGQDTESYNLLADYSQLMSYRECELKASEFRRLALDLHSQGEISPESQDVAIDALLLAAECYIVPRAMKDMSTDLGKFLAMRSSENHGRADINRIVRPTDKNLKLVADIERKRDRVVIELLIEAADLDRKCHKVESEDETTGSDVEGDEGVIKLSQEDTLSADAVTLVRQNQSLLCRFLIRRLHTDAVGEQHSTREILMWCLLFLLHSATKLCCSPEHVVELILNFAESLSVELKDENKQLSYSGLPELQRGLSLLKRLVIASSGSNGRSEVSINVRSGFQFSNLIPSSVWLLKVPSFSSSPFPLVRYFGWMAIAHNAKQYIKERLFLVSDLSQLIHLLSIFSDDLSLVDNMIEQKNVNKSIEEIGGHPDIKFEDGAKSYHQDAVQSFHVLYPDISKLFPTLKKEFEAFGETILEAVGLQLKFLSSTVVPDLISWLANLCSWPFVQSEKCQFLLHRSDYFKGFVAKNAKAVILYMLEVIVVEHMEALVPEIPRVMQVLVALCRSSYCDVAFLDSVLRLLKPIIVHSLTKVPDEEKLLINESCENFESVCFGELFNCIRCPDENQGTASERGRCPALTIFVLATMFGDLSFQCKTELLQSSILWAEFASFEETTVFPDYICAYQVLMENCKHLLIGSLRVWGIIPLETSLHSDAIIGTVDDSSKSITCVLNDICRPSTKVPEKHLDDITAVSDVNQNAGQLTLEEIKSLCSNLEALISKLNPTLENCWIIHHALAKKLAVTTADCFIYSRCLCLCADKVSVSSEAEKYNPTELVEEFPDFWRSSLEGFVKMILLLQENHFWEVAFVLLDSILGLPLSIFSDKVVADVCSAIKNFSNCAPNMCWRLQTDKLLSVLLARKLEDNGQAELPFIDLFSAMLGHLEPEQRYIALKHLGRLVGQDVDGRSFLSSKTEITVETSDLLHLTTERFLSLLVSATWDQVALVASSDKSLLLRTHATSLLISYIPFAERNTLQSFLAAADSVVQCLTTLALPTSYGPLTQFSLVLIASVCLYSPAEDISLIPEHIWSNIETIAISRNGRFYCTGFEKSACEALCRLKKNEGRAKEILKEVLSSSSPKEQLPDFMTTRESILQVIGNLTSARSYFDFFAKEVDHKTMELEEAEIEMELLKTEHQPSDSSLEYQDWHQLPFLSTYTKDERRLMQIKDEIRSIEKAKLREKIAARRHQKLLVRRTRQQFLEDAALREAELLQKLDREKTSEVEKELERRQLLELERAKTRELQHNLDMEKERQAQRELQRELEQVEAGIRPSRREFQSSSQSRTRDRYRERDNEREGNEGNLRTSSRNVQRDTVTTSSSAANVPTVVLAGNRSFSGQPPTILQSRERSDDTGSIEENLSRDSGDTGSVGDPDIVSALEGQSVGFGSGQRHGPRGGKSRQMVDRRERDSGSRREGKWERKH